MTDTNHDFEVNGQVMQGHFPQAAPAAVTASAIGRDQQFFGIAVAFRTHLAPPPPVRFRGEACGIVINTHATLW